MGQLSSFLRKNIVQPSDTLPLVHTTSAHRMRALVRGQMIEPQLCEVFSEHLAYFFVGRPAYKYSRPEKSAKHWELPSCLIFDFDDVRDIRRIFPFDSGAFSRRLYPSFVSMFDLEELEVSSIDDAPQRLIGAFFGDIKRYMALQGKSKSDFEDEYAPTVFDNEVAALNALSTEGSSVSFDDRRFSIEIQSSRSLSLRSKPPIAVVAPNVYFDDSEFHQVVVNEWKSCPLPYRVCGLSIDQYYGQIYEKVFDFYQASGYLK